MKKDARKRSVMVVSSLNVLMTQLYSAIHAKNRKKTVKTNAHNLAKKLMSGARVERK